MPLKRDRPPPAYTPGMAPPGITKRRKFTLRGKRASKRKKMQALLSKPQLKYVDLTQAAVEVNYDGLNQSILNGISTGDTDETRDGQTIVLNSVQIKGLIRADAVDAVVRYMIILDKMPNEQAFSFADIYEYGGDVTDVYALRNRAASAPGRYKILLDRVVAVSTADSSASGGVPYVHHIDHYLKIAELCQFNDDGTGNDTDFQKGKLVFVALSDIAAASTGPTVEYKTRVTFFDK